jgi:predicted N-acyltransferase
MSGPNFTIVETLAGIDAAEWNRLVGDHPLLSHAFLDALHSTGCASDESGWAPRFIVGSEKAKLVAAMPLYLKTHSYGEYVFDWSWAMRIGGTAGATTKLVSAIPFTPAMARD